MKTVKIIISLVLIIALISSFICTPAYAITPEIAISAGGLAAIIATLFGIDLAFNDMSDTDITSYFNNYAPSSPLYVDFILDVINNPTGTISVFLNKALFDYFRDMNDNFIADNNITDNMLSNIGVYEGYSYLGYAFPYTYASTKYGIIASGELPKNGSNLIGSTSAGINFNNSGTSNYVNRNTYLNNNIIYSEPSGQTTNSSNPGYVIIGVSTIFGKVGVGWKGINKSYIDYFDLSNEVPEYINQNIDVETGEIDTTVGSDLPAAGGVTITAPAPTETLDIYGIIKYLIDLFKEQPEDLTLDLVQEEPGPDTGPTIAESPFIDLIGLFRHLENDIQDQVNDVIGLFEESITKQEEISDVIDDRVGALEETLEEQHTDVIGLFDTAIDSIQEGFSDVIGLFEDVGETITDIYDTVVEKVGSIDLSLDSILEALQSLVESIETAAVDLFSDFLSAIQSIFAPILGRIRSALGIWHYVVEWLNCIGGVFTWIFGLCSGTAYCMVVPIYASIAAAICIALYKRFGR